MACQFGSAWQPVIELSAVSSTMAENTPQPRAMIVGLGNPGTAYAAHRHNIGFRVVDALARAYGLRFVRQKHAQAHVAEGSICDSAIVLAKPQKYMNRSGKAVRRLVRKYGLPPDQILVVYDDLDLPLGRIRLRQVGGAGGHKGMLSIIEQLGTRDFPRLRVGIGRPPGRMDPADYVLEPFDEEDAFAVSDAVDIATSAIEVWIREGIIVAMDRYNRRLLTDDKVDGRPPGKIDAEPCSDERSDPILKGSAGAISKGNEG